jgi:putative membrane protein
MKRFFPLVSRFSRFPIRTSVFTSALTLLCLASSLHGLHGAEPGAAPAQKETKQTLKETQRERPRTESGLSASDVAFFKVAAHSGLAEVRLGELAQKNAGGAEVKEFGSMMVSDHTRLNDELSALAGQKGVTLPKELSSKHQALVSKLSKLSGSDFDKAYASEMLKDHKKDIALFQATMERTNDAELKALTERSLPILRRHLQAAEQLNKAKTASLH